MSCVQGYNHCLNHIQQHDGGCNIPCSSGNFEVNIEQ